MNLNDLRFEINRIDEALVTLLNKRATLALQIGELKIKQNLPVLNEARETEVLDFVKKNNTGPLNDDQIVTLFQKMMEICRNAQYQSRKD